MLRKTSLIAYSVGCLLAAYLALVSITANLHLPIAWSVENLAWLFLPMLVAMVASSSPNNYPLPISYP